MSNIKFNYIYRDASNYKNYGSVVFKNPDAITLDDAEKRIKNTLSEGEHFVASQVNVPEVFLWLTSSFTEDDHYWHEFSSLEEVSCDITDDRTISEFIAELEKVGPLLWEADELFQEAI